MTPGGKFLASVQALGRTVAGALLGLGCFLLDATRLLVLLAYEVLAWLQATASATLRFVRDLLLATAILVGGLALLASPVLAYWLGTHHGTARLDALLAAPAKSRVLDPDRHGFWVKVSPRLIEWVPVPQDPDQTTIVDGFPPPRAAVTTTTLPERSKERGR